MLRYFWPSDDEQLAGQFVDSHLDEDAGWWIGVQKAGASLALAAGLLVASATSLVAQQVFSQSQDDPAGSLVAPSVLVQEEYWQNPVAPINWPQPLWAISDNVETVPFVSHFVPDDTYWQTINVPQPLLRFPLSSADSTPQFTPSVAVIDDQALWVPQVTPQETNWTLLFFLDDGSAVHAFEPDEDFLPGSALPAPCNWPQPQQPFAASDDDNLVPVFVAAEDPLWLQLVPPVPATLTWPLPWQFEQNEEAAGLVTFTDELFWQNPTPPVQASLGLLQQWPFEQNEPAGNLSVPAFEETLWQNPTSPIPASLGLLQQWPFEQNEAAGNLRNTFDEDFWQNPVLPVVWPRPSIFSDDVVIVAQSVATVDEIYWSQLVQPVPASLKGLYGLALYLPDVEEIPAGSLVPFIPPPPAFCPLPPTGPDADTSISNFSNFRGGVVLALFCRICNSGKPLVVRGDYAIWCPDCCAFVSKQDTYMGTVRAPGVFRGRF